MLDFMRKEGTGWGLGTRGRLHEVNSFPVRPVKSAHTQTPVGLWPLWGITFLGAYSVDHSLGNNVLRGFLAPQAAM